MESEDKKNLRNAMIWCFTGFLIICPITLYFWLPGEKTETLGAIFEPCASFIAAIWFIKSLKDQGEQIKELKKQTQLTDGWQRYRYIIETIEILDRTIIKSDIDSYDDNEFTMRQHDVAEEMEKDISNKSLGLISYKPRKCYSFYWKPIKTILELPVFIRRYLSLINSHDQYIEDYTKEMLRVISISAKAARYFLAGFLSLIRECTSLDEFKDCNDLMEFIRNSAISKNKVEIKKYFPIGVNRYVDTAIELSELIKNHNLEIYNIILIIITPEYYDITADELKEILERIRTAKEQNNYPKIFEKHIEKFLNANTPPS